MLARRGDETAKRELSARFQVAIDRAAMYAGLFGTDEYLAEWARDTRPCGDDLETEVAAEARALERVRLRTCSTSSPPTEERDDRHCRLLGDS